MPTISKSRFINGLQCHKLLWYAYNQKESIPEPDAATMAKFEQGYIVGEYAKKLFPDGIEVAKGIVNFAEVVPASRKAARLQKPMFEAAFEHGGAYARADILEPVPGGKWDLIEVKSSNEVKEHHYHDVALQKYVYDGAGIRIRRCYLLHLNKAYVRRGEIDPCRFFVKTDITKEVKSILDEIAPDLRKMATVIKRPAAPDIPIGPHCSDPYACPLMSLCWGFLPKHNVTELYRGGKKQYELIEKGILQLADIPDEFRLTNSQKIQVAAVRNGKPHVNEEGIREFLASLKYPIYFLDFETFATAVPLIDEARPHQQIPFQYSLHILNSPNEEPVHLSYLADGPIDPRPNILSSLKKQLGSKGTILTFNKSFETARLKEMSRDYPEYGRWFEKIKPRIADLIIPFRRFAYYHPDQEGAASMKSVLPALTGRSYSDLGIREGGTASLEFIRMTFGQVTAEERDRVRKDLLIYCGLDTEGMIDILRALARITNNGEGLLCRVQRGENHQIQKIVRPPHEQTRSKRSRKKSTSRRSDRYQS
jgi:hypothetical protein